VRVTYRRAEFREEIDTSHIGVESCQLGFIPLSNTRDPVAQYPFSRIRNAYQSRSIATSIPALERARIEVEDIIMTSMILVIAMIDAEAVPS
jgi:hypothetical protein